MDGKESRGIVLAKGVEKQSEVSLRVGLDICDVMQLPQLLHETIVCS